MFEILIFIVSVLFLSVISVVFLRLKNKNLELEMIIGNTIEDIEMLRKGYSGDALVEKEHLISFLTQTREDAYKYIEDIQKVLSEHIDEIESITNDLDGATVIKLKLSLNKLKKIMPGEIPND